MIRTTLAKMLTAKLAVAAAATAAVTVGGVATVAATSNLPTGLGGHSTETPAASSMAASASSHRAAPSTTKSAEPDGTPSPSLVGLCHAYTAGAGSDHGKALESPAFTYLINTAGGKDEVDAYCAKVLADKDASSAATTTTSAAKDHSSQAHPTEDPRAAHATGVPSTKPSH